MSEQPDGLPLDEWAAKLVAALDLPPELAGLDVRQLVLDLARDTAHSVARPAAPLTTFLAGAALGRAGGSGTDTLDEIAQRVRAEFPR